MRSLFVLLIIFVFAGCKSSQVLKSSIIAEDQIEQEKTSKVDVSDISSMLKVLSIDKDSWLNVKIYSPVDSLTNHSYLLAEANYYNKDKINLKDSIEQNITTFEDNRDLQKENFKTSIQEHEVVEKNSKSVLEQISGFLWALVGISIIILLILVKTKKWF